MITIIIYAVIAGVCLGFTWIKGGPAERYGALLYGSAWLLVTAYELITGEGIPVIPFLAMDFAVAVGFLVLAIRFNNLWLGVAMMLQGLEFGLHTARLNAANHPRIFGWDAYVLGVNIISLAVLLCMVGAALATTRNTAARGVDDDPWETPQA